MEEFYNFSFKAPRLNSILLHMKDKFNKYKVETTS